MATLPAIAGLYGCGTDAETSVEDEVAILNDALTLELSLVAAYEIGTELLSDTAAEAADLFADQEREHADALRDAIEEAGGIPVEPRSRRGYERMLRLDELDEADDFLRLAVDLEQTAIGGYNVAVPRLASPPLRRIVYSIASAEAAHVTVLLGELGEVQAPDAFVAGARA